MHTIEDRGVSWHITSDGISLDVGKGLHTVLNAEALIALGYVMTEGRLKTIEEMLSEQNIQSVNSFLTASLVLIQREESKKETEVPVQAPAKVVSAPIVVPEPDPVDPVVIVKTVTHKVNTFDYLRATRLMKHAKLLSTVLITMLVLFVVVLIIVVVNLKHGELERSNDETLSGIQ